MQSVTSNHREMVISLLLDLNPLFGDPGGEFKSKGNRHV